MDIVIRTASKADAPHIARFQLAMALETENKELDLKLVTTAVEAVFEDEKKGFYLVAEANGAVVGSLMITYEWSDWRNSWMWYFQSVFIEKASRGQGIFSKMYQKVMALAKENEVSFVRLYVETENHHAQKVYEQLGMERMHYYMYDVEVK